MAKHYEFYIKKDGVLSEDDTEQMQYIHCQNFFGVPDATLCGKVFEGECEAHWTISGMIDVRETDKKISCPDCILIIKSCKSVKTTEIKKPH